MSRERQVQLLGEGAEAEWIGAFRTTIDHGYSISDTSTTPDQVSIAAPIFEVDGTPTAAVVVSAPIPRLPEELRPALGELVARTARGLSRGVPAQWPATA
jgi:IclR family acetate operon transcriptional repressor